MSTAEEGNQRRGKASIFSFGCHARHSRLPSITVELIGRKISWNFGETTATGGLFTRGSVRGKRQN